MAALGFAIFGVGVEVAGITVSKIIVKWFKGKEMALAMGMQVSVARLGTALAIGVSAPIAIRMGHVSKPILLGLVTSVHRTHYLHLIHIYGQKAGRFSIGCRRGQQYGP